MYWKSLKDAKLILRPLAVITSVALLSGCFGDDSNDPPVQAPPAPVTPVTPPPVEVPGDAEDTSGQREALTTEIPENEESAMIAAFEGGVHGEKEDAAVRNFITKAESDGKDNHRFNVPTNGSPSPLFGATAFTQQLLRFEEFGTKALEFGDFDDSDDGAFLPAPESVSGFPDSEEIDEFLGEDMFPQPTRWANTVQNNPWEPLVESYLGRDLDDPPIEGRPPGEGWAHQRWDEFKPQRYFQTVQTGGRTNRGFRDEYQTHEYAMGEFGPGGLYHNTTGNSGSDGTTSGIQIKFHPNMPVQSKETLWTFDGTFPPKLLKVKYGEPVLMRHHNGLPVDVSANKGFGLHTISTHEHNGHNPAESDGYANAFFFLVSFMITVGLLR